MHHLFCKLFLKHSSVRFDSDLDFRALHPRNQFYSIIEGFYWHKQEELLSFVISHSNAFNWVSNVLPSINHELPF
ncbi:unnamed protein product [Clavelina lepadiformis]|uniref:Maturase K n=1 Tax=Clavelina lepadiformis TaxID=159417 RepID=A0ABP0FI14_CLALP